MKNNRKGFTLAELLIVVAIIAVLVAIAIPVFSGALDKANAAVDNANVRSAYAQATTAQLLQGPSGDATYDSTTKTATCSAGVMLAKWDKTKIANITIADPGWAAGDTVAVVVAENGSASLTITPKA